MILLTVLSISLFSETYKHIRPPKPGFYGVRQNENNEIEFVEIKRERGSENTKRINNAEVTAYDFRLVSGSLAIDTVKDQQSCGGCWAFASTDVAGSSLYINEGWNYDFSPQHLISCPVTRSYGPYEYEQMGCDGGYPIIAFIEGNMSGFVQESCVPWVTDGARYTCPTTCVSGGTTQNSRKGQGQFDYFDAYLEDLPFLRDLVITSGPCVAEMEVYDDLSQYVGGVYEHSVGGDTEGHAVTIYGFGTEGGVNYWLVKNSWGADWGLNGFFKIRMGTNESGIESNFYSLYNWSDMHPTSVVPLPAQTTPGDCWDKFCLNGGRMVKTVGMLGLLLQLAVFFLFVY